MVNICCSILKYVNDSTGKKNDFCSLFPALIGRLLFYRGSRDIIFLILLIYNRFLQVMKAIMRGFAIKQMAISWKD